MKKFLFLLLLFPIVSKAQFSSDIVVYNSDNQTFMLIIDNNIPYNQYKNKFVLTDVPVGEHQIVIEFQDARYPAIYYVIQVPISSMAIFKIEPVGYTNNHTLKLETTYQYHGHSFIQPPQPAIRQPYPYTPQNPLPTPTPTPNYYGGCSVPTPPSEFTTILQNIDKQDFESTKLSLAKQIVASKCLTSQQIKQIANLFSFDDDKLEFLKYAYTYVYDPDNYHIVVSALSFNSSKNELIKYIQQQNTY